MAGNDRPMLPLWRLPLAITDEERKARLERIMAAAAKDANDGAKQEPQPVAVTAPKPRQRRKEQRSPRSGKFVDLCFADFPDRKSYRAAYHKAMLEQMSDAEREAWTAHKRAQAKIGRLRRSKDPRFADARKRRSKQATERRRAKLDAMSAEERAAYQAKVREKRRAWNAAKSEERRLDDRAKQLERERKRYKRISDLTIEQADAKREYDRLRRVRKRKQEQQDAGSKDTD